MTMALVQLVLALALFDQMSGQRVLLTRALQFSELSAFRREVQFTCSRKPRDSLTNVSTQIGNGSGYKPCRGSVSLGSPCQMTNASVLLFSNKELPFAAKRAFAALTRIVETGTMAHTEAPELYHAQERHVSGARNLAHSLEARP